MNDNKNNNDKNNDDNNISMIAKNVNIYEELKKVCITSDALYNRYFILNYYQTIPRYYLLCNNKNINSCIYNFSVGSGKTAASLFVILNNVDLYKKYLFNKSFVPAEVNNNINFSINKNVFVIGSWVTVSAVSNELMKEEFGLIKKNELEKYKELLNSNIKENREEAEKYRKKLINGLGKYINFYGYQAFVNACFPNLGNQDIMQNCKILIEHYRNGELSIAAEFREKLRNSIIIIDECQKLYSIDGMNSYGFAVMCVNKLAKDLNIKMVFLSGTIFNTSLSELVSIVNIMSEYNDEEYNKNGIKYKTNKGIFDDDECLYSKEIIEGINANYPTDKFIKVANDLLKERFIYYDHSKLSKMVEYKGILRDINDTKDIKKYNKGINNDLFMLKFPERENLPIEQQIGNVVIEDEKEGINMLLYSCEVEGYQKEQYNKYIKSQTSDIIDDEDETTLSIHDVGFPNSSEFIKLGIIKNKSEYIGKFLELNNIRKYSAIGYNLVKICLEKTTNKEKIICYHNKLNNFGIFQYMLILQANGFIKYGDTHKNNSICKECGNTYDIHNLDINERIKHKCCNEFKPIYYYYLIGNMSQTEREDIVNNVFNSPENIHGDLLSIMFVSDVAYSGVSFLNTNNIILLSKISNISKWKQICARIIRTKSHVALPKNRRYANIYTMIIHHPDEKGFLYEQKYYILRRKLNRSIEEYINDIEKNTIGYKLFNNPRSIESDEKERKDLIDMYCKDISKNIDNIIFKYVKNEPDRIWKLETFLDRLQNDKESYTYLNLNNINRNFLISIISTNPKAILFNYESDNTNTTYIRFKHKRDKSLKITSQFSFRDLEMIPRNEKILNSLLKKLYETPFLINKRKYIDKIIKYCGNRWELLTTQDTFWRIIYDIHDEFYEDDETNFIFNHATKNRNITKMKGMYYNDLIILRDGRSIKINLTFPKYNGWKDIPYIFRISSIQLTDASPFYLHVNVLKRQTEQEDGRRISRGITCIGFETSEINKYFGIQIENYDNRHEICLVLMQTVIDKQFNNMEDRNVYTPFEK